MSNMNKITISNAIKKAQEEFKGIKSEVKISNPFLVDSDIFPSETFNFANSSFFNPEILGEFNTKPACDWSKKDFLDLIKNLYFKKFVTSPHIPHAYGYMYLNVIEEICLKNFPNSNVKILKAKYIHWYFENYILKDTIKYRSAWNIRKMVHPKVAASFIMYASGKTEKIEQEGLKQVRLPVNESLLDLYYRGEASDFVKCYGFIIPFAFLFYSKKLSWDDCLEYTVSAIKDLVINKNCTDKTIRSVTEQYSPYNSMFDKIAPDKISVALTEKTGLNLVGVKLK